MTITLLIIGYIIIFLGIGIYIFIRRMEIKRKDNISPIPCSGCGIKVPISLKIDNWFGVDGKEYCTSCYFKLKKKNR